MQFDKSRRDSTRHAVGGVMVKNMMARALRGTVAVRKAKKIKEAPMPDALARFFRPIA